MHSSTLLFSFADINECKNNPCDKKTESCNNTPGSYNCKCKKGFVRTKKGHCTKKKENKKKSKKGTKKTWKDQLHDDILSGKAFQRDELVRLFAFGHVFLLAISMILYKYGRFYLLAVLGAVYGVVISLIYTRYAKDILH